MTCFFYKFGKTFWFERFLHVFYHFGAQLNQQGYLNYNIICHKLTIPSPKPLQPPFFLLKHKNIFKQKIKIFVAVPGRRMGWCRLQWFWAQFSACWAVPPNNVFKGIERRKKRIQLWDMYAMGEKYNLEN